MRPTERLAEAVQRLRLSNDFHELLSMLKKHRDELTHAAIFAAGDEAELLRGRAQEAQLLVETLETAPEQYKKRLTKQGRG